MLRTKVFEVPAAAMTMNCLGVMVKTALAVCAIAIAAQTLAIRAVAQTSEPKIEQPSVTESDNDEGSSNDPMAQLPSVSNLSDVQPNDWAFQALQSLKDRYGCITGYPDGTYRGNRAMTRYDFAAGLNSCLNRINELIASGTTKPISQQDLNILQRLQAEFAAELTALRGRVDAIEARTAQLEANQFSTTTKLTGSANFSILDAFSGQGDDQSAFQERIRLTFNTSFTGKDSLITRLQTGNSTVPNLANGTRQGVLTHQWYGDFGNNLALVTAFYFFPITENFQAVIEAAGGLHADYAPTVNPYFEDYDAGTTSLSVFSQRNPIYRLGGGSGVGFIYKINDALTLSTGYLGGNASNPGAGNGLFNGSYSSLTQLTWNASKELTLALTYNHAYFSRYNFAFGDNSGAFGLGGYTGSGIVNTSASNASNCAANNNNTLACFTTVTNSYGGEVSWKIDPKLAIGGWVGLTKVRAIGVGDGDIWNYAITVAFPDLGKKGNLGGFVVGAEPYLSKLENSRIARNKTSLHVEGFYKYQLTDNISITPGVVWITNPNQDINNEDIVIGALRTTFTF